MNKTKKGFTLIELLVVVLIIGILSAVALPQYNKAVEKSRATEAITTLKAISDAQSVAYLSDPYCGTGNFDNLDISFTGQYGYVACGSSMSQQNFYYWLDCGSSCNYNAVAGRINSNYSYELMTCDGGPVVCSGSDCKKAGFSRSVACVDGSACGACYAM